MTDAAAPAFDIALRMPDDLPVLCERVLFGWPTPASPFSDAAAPVGVFDTAAPRPPRAAPALALVGTLAGCSMQLRGPGSTVLDPATTPGTPSGFGDLRAATTAFDPAVRWAEEYVPGGPEGLQDVALQASLPELPPHDPFFSDTEEAEDAIGNDVCHCLRHAVAEAMFGLPRAVFTLELYKVNVYRPGGHFADHADTPRAGVVATLVVTHPGFPHEGGHLEVDGPPGAGSVSSADAVSAAGGLTFVAFLPHLVHRVTPVTAGVRVTAVFHVKARPGLLHHAFTWQEDECSERAQAVEAGLVMHSRLREPPGAVESCVAQVRAALATFRNGPTTSFAVAMVHPYSYDEVDGGVLKGVDVVLREMMVAAGLTQVVLMPVLMDVCVVLDYCSKYEVDGKEVTRKVLRLTRKDLKKAAVGVSEGRYSARGVVDYVFVPWQAAVMGEAHRRNTDGGHYHGNEFQPTVENNFYWQCVLVGKGPEARGRM
jgi:hypothetical protein